MLFDLERPDNPITYRDITAVIGLRAHKDNPWVLERLRALSGYYEPQPPILVVDFGSDGDFRAAVEESCQQQGLEYVHVPDYDTYSASMCHNACLPHIDTKLLFFMDIDFVGVQSLFADLVRVANAASMQTIFDVVIDLPAYHIGKDKTEDLERYSDSQRKSAKLDKIGFSAQNSEFGSLVEFIAPYSNIMLMTKKYFDLSGGYHPIFRGHGSEDFEFLVRTAGYSGVHKSPSDLSDPRHGPGKWDFWRHKSYRGFRSLNQLVSARAERAGLKIYHRWHPTPQNTEWRKENDWRRQKLTKAFNAYEGDPSQLITIDGHSRGKKAICICKHKDHWGYFLPLRLHGYDLIPFFDDKPKSIGQISDLMDNGDVDALAIFNPYMKSHSQFFRIFEKARSKGLKTIVVERGALPNTIYYSNDVSYAPNSFTDQELGDIKLSDQELTATRNYLASLKRGDHLLEDATSRELTAQKYQDFIPEDKIKIFIPLQLDDDMAVTKFVRDAQNYASFAESISEVAAGTNDAIFILKPHPLSKNDISDLPNNVIIADRSDNVHELIELCDAVVCYNSGVGLLAACHEKPIVTVGNAYYNVKGLGHFADSLQDAVSLVKRNCEAPSSEIVEEIVGKYLFHKYSWFSADDDIQDFKHRKAHGYRNIRVSRSVIDGTALEHFWEQSVRPSATRTYTKAMANMYHPEDALPEGEGDALQADKKIQSLWSFQLYSLIYGPMLSKEKSRELKNSPVAFFGRAKYLPSRFGRWMFRRHLR